MIHITKRKSQVIQRLCSNKTIMPQACNASPLGMHVNDEERKRGFAESEGLMTKVVLNRSWFRHCALIHCT